MDADLPAHERPALLVSQDLRRDVAEWRREEPLRVRRVRQQCLHLPSQRFVISACRRRRTRRARPQGVRAPRRRGRRYAAGTRDRSRTVSFELAQQPELRQAPVAFDGVGGHVQHFRRLLHAQAAEESELDGSGSFAHRLSPMPLMRDPAPGRPTPGPATATSCFVQRHPLRAAAAFAIAARPRMIDEHAAHQASRDAQEVGAVLPAHGAGRRSVAETPRSRPPWSAACGRGARGPCSREPAGAAPLPRAAAADRARFHRRRSTPEAEP